MNIKIYGRAVEANLKFIATLIFEYFSVILTVILVIIVLSNRKEARATLAWVLLIVFLPYLGAVIYIIFGNPRLKMIEKKVKRKKDIRYEIASEVTDEYKLCLIGNLVTKINDINPLLCENLEFLNSASIKYARLAEDILSAKEYILMEYYVFRQDETGKFFINLLNKKLREGVKVYLLYDGVGAIGLSIKNTLREFKKLGGKSAAFLSPFNVKFFTRVNFRNHRKVAIIDGKVCYIGGINIGNEYIGDLLKGSDWIDAHIRFSGEAVVAALELFVEDWYFATGKDISNFIKRPEWNMKGDTSMHLIPSGPDEESSKIYNTIFTLINGAKKNINILTPYLVPDEPVVELLKFASNKGVDINIILPGKNNHPLVAAAGRSYYEDLVDSGIKIYETSNTMLHAKIITVDDRISLIGSANIDNRSFKLNFELSALIYKEKFTSTVLNFIESYKNASVLIDNEFLKNKKLYVKMFESACRTISPVL